ncbi:hypothetical protein E1B28_009417 [Marasmius oreades]|uniref:alpha-galactosidase n=1 Tax=Marasmius oreades TaxID=181124 RepID=A0A9P7S0H7_9AGAR|nr:uncharacterized protein E1B28_009417 [Marasmius oreades]KAG7093134.1 hypothetical protein E1B28_009417 [Marasmius oreades]
MISSILLLFVFSFASTNAGVMKRVITPLPANGKFDYQIGGAYTPDVDVQVVTRDRTDSPAPNKYNICYINAFQTQTDDNAFWKCKFFYLALSDPQPIFIHIAPAPERDHLLLRRANGNYFIDPGWPGEILFDTSTAANREEIATIINGWISGCQQSGFSAIEPDNFDSYSRSNGRLTFNNNVQLAKLLADYAHSLNMAFGQKNAAEKSVQAKAGAGFDFAIAEQCQEFDECDSYTDVYGNQVLEIEYYDTGLSGNGLDNFNDACQARGSQISVIFRDVDVKPAGANGRVYQEC